MTEQAHQEEHSHWKTYVMVAFVLGVLTLIEVWALYLNVPADMREPVRIPVLFLLATFKFVLVVAIFMHLKYENRLLTGFFVSGLVMALGTLIAMVALLNYQPTLMAKTEPSAMEVKAMKEKKHMPEEVPVEKKTISKGGDLEQGKVVFRSQCIACHQHPAVGTDGGEIGPSLAGIMERAATRVDGLNAEAYIQQSITEPGAYVVDGFPNAMPPGLKEQMTEQQFQDLLALLMSSEATVKKQPEQTSSSEKPTATPVAQAKKTPEPAGSGDSAAGKKVFITKQCTACHKTNQVPEAGGTIGPTLDGLGKRASERVKGMEATAYIEQSIAEPGAFVVEGFANIMPPDQKEQMSAQEFQDLVAFLKTL